MHNANRLSSAQREAVARQDAPFLMAGLILGDTRSFEAHVRQATKLLRDRQTSTSPCTRMVRHVCDLFEHSVPPSARARLACASGCAFCCYQPVRVSQPEAFFLARLVAEHPESIAAVREAATGLDGRHTNRPGAFWRKCPLLDPSGHCSFYAGRPLACHSYVSMNVSDCKTAYHKPSDELVRAPIPYQDLQSNCLMILQASIRLNGLLNRHYELNAALVAVLDTENAEKRWLRGENIFAHLPELSPNHLEMEQLLAVVVERVGPTV